MDAYKAKKLCQTLYLLSMFLGVWCTFLAMINDKFGGRFGTYAILYGLVVFPQITLNLLTKYTAVKSKNTRFVGVCDIVQTIVAVSALSIMVILSGNHKDDTIFMIPWVVILVLNIIVSIYFKRKYQ